MHSDLGIVAYCGMLQSHEALYLERRGKGWLRVEVVPGNTPLLVSNAVVEGMRGIVDPHYSQMRFHGSGDVLVLRRVRKKLNCVKVRDLLNIHFSDGSGETCFHTHTQQHHKRQHQRGKHRPTTTRQCMKEFKMRRHQMKLRAWHQTPVS